jgi:hypothetical protein
MPAMNKTIIGVTVGAIAIGHYVGSPYLPLAADAPDSPPLSSLIGLSTGTGTLTLHSQTIDAVTDAEYDIAPLAGLTVVVWSR